MNLSAYVCILYINDFKYFKFIFYKFQKYMIFVLCSHYLKTFIHINKCNTFIKFNIKLNFLIQFFNSNIMANFTAKKRTPKWEYRFSISKLPYEIAFSRFQVLGIKRIFLINLFVYPTLFSQFFKKHS
jgi:hypothetical protein